MALKLKLPDSRRPVRSAPRPAPSAVKGKPARVRAFSLSDPLVKLFVAGFVGAGILFLAMFTYVYVKYERIVDRRMAGPIFTNAAKIYARPQTVSVGDKTDAAEIAAQLHRAGYSQEGQGNDSPVGHFRVASHSIQITPGPESVHASHSAVITFQDGKINTISEAGKPDVAAYELEPQLVTALFEGQERSKRELITFNDIPKVMVDAVLAIEDRRFFQHNGVNYFRLLEAAAADLRSGHHGQGGSTITMQLSRGFFLSPEKTVKRKMVEMLIAFELEEKFSKQRIFEMYANQVYMGQRGSFTIAGFAEASHAYFNKDIKNLTLPEAALLAGIIQRPNYLSPYKNPKRALERRNLVLDSMVETGAITRDEAERAKAAPLKLAAPNVEASDAPYFVDLVKDQLSNQYSEAELNDHAFRIYTTLDPDLQRAAAEAVDEGMKLVDEQVTKRRTHKTKVGTGKDAKTETKVDSGPMPQVALVAIDPHTGEVLALVGGRNYGMSQLDHAIAKRPTGSIFKPFVYAAAINTSLAGDTAASASDSDAEASSGSTGAFTPATLVDDSPVSIAYGDQLYEPRNYKEEYHGEVTARYALAMSLNNATVRVAQEAGFGKVAALAKAAGIISVRATPAIALGSYDATPLEMAGSLHGLRQRRHTAFADHAEVGARLERPCAGGVSQRKQVGARPARGLCPDDHDGKRGQQRHRLHRPSARFSGSGRRQDRNVTRRLVCRLHDEPALHRLGRQRRLYGPEAEWQLNRRAHLGRVHEAGRQAAAVLERKELPCSLGRGRGDPGQADQSAGDLYVSAGLHGRLHRGHRTEGDLRRCFHRSPGNRHQDPWTGHASGRCAAVDDQWRCSELKRAAGPSCEQPACDRPATSSQEEEGLLQPALRQGRQQR